MRQWPPQSPIGTPNSSRSRCCRCPVLVGTFGNGHKGRVRPGEGTSGLMRVLARIISAAVPFSTQPETEKLSEVLLQLNETSLSQLRRDHETGHLQDRQRLGVRPRLKWQRPCFRCPICDGGPGRNPTTALPSARMTSGRPTGHEKAPSAGVAYGASLLMKSAAHV
jgi:hypothetical protein